MNQRTWATLFIVAGAQLTIAGCSPSQSIPEAEPATHSLAQVPNKHPSQGNINAGGGHQFQKPMIPRASPQPAPRRPVQPHAVAAPPQYRHPIQQPQYVNPEHYYQPTAYGAGAMQPNQAVQFGNGVPALEWNELRRIGEQIFTNESGGSINNLVHWNDGENFASMGIGHFTWYPAGRAARFGNTFPQLLDHLERNGVPLPEWVRVARHTGAPWRSKTELLRAKNTPQVQELQNLLYQTRDLQAQYIVERTRLAMPKLVKTSPPHLQPLVAQNLDAIANTPGGWYLIIDYVNFKGEGLNRSGGYRGQNWGLLQVLENMRPAYPGQDALNAFADSAMQVLARRVQNSPSGSGEERWLAGWSRRINTYRVPLV